MKRLKWIIPTAVVLLLVIAVLVFTAGKDFSTGYCIVADNNSRLIVLDGSPIRLSNRSRSEDMLYKYDTGDKLLVLHDGIEETYPGGTGAYFCIKIGEGSAADIPEDVFIGLAELGWLSDAYLKEIGIYADSGAEPEISGEEVIACPPAEPEAYAFTAQYARTNGVSDGGEYPQVIILRSFEELNAYIEENRDSFNLETEFIPACARYDEGYFLDNDLILIRLEESSGSVRHEVTDVRRASGGWQISIDRRSPEAGTCDMAQWHILLEIQMGKVVGENENVNIVFDSYTRVGFTHKLSTVTLDIPEGWEYSIQELGEDSYAAGGICFRPTDEAAGWVKLYCYDGGFGVCGTGLEEKELKLTNGVNGHIGYYDSNPVWNFIVIDGIDNYAFTHEQADWLSRRQDEIFSIISSVKHETDVISCYIEYDQPDAE